MPKRTCAACGKEKDVEGGKTCENGHFICKEDIWKNAGLLSGPLKTCPLDKKPLK